VSYMPTPEPRAARRLRLLGVAVAAIAVSAILIRLAGFGVSSWVFTVLMAGAVVLWVAAAAVHARSGRSQ